MEAVRSEGERELARVDDGESTEEDSRLPVCGAC